jgi:thymidylate kinase
MLPDCTACLPVSQQNSDVVIFDRYIYDQIANIYSPSFAARSYARILLKQTPAPDLAFVLDASPTAAFARKPEYPLEFMHQESPRLFCFSGNLFRS